FLLHLWALKPKHTLFFVCVLALATLMFLQKAHHGKSVSMEKTVKLQLLAASDHEHLHVNNTSQLENVLPNRLFSFSLKLHRGDLSVVEPSGANVQPLSPDNDRAGVPTQRKIFHHIVTIHAPSRRAVLQHKADYLAPLHKSIANYLR